MLLAPNRQQVLKLVEWKDLTHMSQRDGLRECAIILPWLFASWLLLALGNWLLAIPATFMFFLTALRLNHEAIHHNLGFRASGHHNVMHALSALMLLSNHSVAFNHLRHHRHVGSDQDLEGKCGRMKGWQVLLYGPMFPYETHRAALSEGGPKVRSLVRRDLALNLLLPLLALLPGLQFLWLFIALMVLAQCLTAFFAVWITHHGCGDDDLMVARSQRSKLVNMLSYNMFFHLEHHLYPTVPVSRLPRLAERLDRAIPQIRARLLPVVGFARPAIAD